jgi:hypothetical protein
VVFAGMSSLNTAPVAVPVPVALTAIE